MVLAAAGPARLHAEAILEGRVVLPEGQGHVAPVANQRYEIVSRAGVIGPNPPVAVVYLEGEFPAPAEPASAEVGQRGLEFIPRLLPVRTGTRVAFPNYDEVYHNVFSFSPVKRFDLGRYRPDERPVPVQVFERPGLVTLRCDIHEHMRAVILVLDTPHFVVTGTDGRFRLTGLPAGRYTLKAWLDSRTTRAVPVELRDGETAQAELP